MRVGSNTTEKLMKCHKAEDTWHKQKDHDFNVIAFERKYGDWVFDNEDCPDFLS